MLISETIETLEELKSIYGDIPLVKWEIDSGINDLNPHNFIVVANADFSTTRYATAIAIKGDIGYDRK